MPRRLQNPDSWLHVARVRADYQTVRSLAERLGVALSQVVEWGRGRQKPKWEHIPNLAEALGLGAPEVITGMWGESVEDLCPCGCGGQKILPDSPGARKLLIEIPCANCETTRTRIQGNTRFHRDLCPKCVWGPEKFTCVGIDDHGRRDWAKTCPPPHKLLLLPREIREYQKAQKPPHAPFNLQPRFIDESQKTLRCPRCAHAAMIIAVTEKRIKDALAKKYPAQNLERIQSQSKRLALLSKNIREINPQFLEAGGAAAPKNPYRSEEARRSLARNNVAKPWSKEALRFYRMGICPVCEKLTFDTKRPTKCHRPRGIAVNCYSVQLRSPEKFLSRRGRPVDEGTLRIRYKWAVQYYVGREEDGSYRKIAEENNIADFTIVRDGIEFIMNKLPPAEFVPRRFRPTIQSLHDAIRSPLRSMAVRILPTPPTTL